MLIPSPLYAGERVRVRGRNSHPQNCVSRQVEGSPLTLALSPEYRGEGIVIAPFSLHL